MHFFWAFIDEKKGHSERLIRCTKFAVDPVRYIVKPKKVSRMTIL